MFIDQLQLVLPVVQNLQFPDPGNGARVWVFEHSIDLISSCREAHSSKHVLLVSDITVWHSRFLSFVHMADLHAAFRSCTHGRERCEFGLEQGVAVQVACLDRRRLPHPLESLLRDC